MRKLVVSIIAITAASAVFAGAGDVEKRLKEQYPATRITEVRESAIKGLYEVVMGRNVAYTDESGRYMLFGRLYDMKEQKDLTALRLEEVNKIDVSALPLADAIKTVKGDGSRTLYVFSDPDCPFCQRLERETVPLLDNVTIYTFLYPLEGLHPDAPAKSRRIWCAQDRYEAYRAYMEKGTLPANDGSCPNPVDRNVRLGAGLGIDGTPTIILGDGWRVSGFLPAAELERRLAAGAPQRARTAAGG
ncbi:DsbC family protein [Pelomicrobium methylotrophicum]|uniref:Thiol:disulfide interchange protein n=1 Tax=Pelomicrobium methylotrophicum TaxID=2602750 RepID=A0A5C7EG45_9PROT|nr:DsbC family protein [Pelomicrobium methylotrophicum]TXF11202.1 DsbC family protein [Pelomicrobium methylotrophicum]